MSPKLPDLFTKLLDVYESHGDIIIALDFDDTIFDWKNSGYNLEYIVDIVLRAQNILNAKVILFTCRQGNGLQEAVNYCSELGIKLHGVNENPDFPPTSSKPFYNVILDDKACLPEVAKVLSDLINWRNKQ